MALYDKEGKMIRDPNWGNPTQKLKQILYTKNIRQCYTKQFRDTTKLQGNNAAKKLKWKKCMVLSDSYKPNSAI